mmetsp:Transcript_6967/g.6122  ORF Transcript_6967/g.6122 Transcript_6967/m.6122 type:complete len:91 (+) Transcript_6967:346-618(+)
MRASLFLSSILLSIMMLIQLIMSNMKENGLISYAPLKLRNVLLNWSFYDVMCELFYFRTFTTMIYNVVNPFIQSSSPEEAKKLLDSMKNQ